jgi:pimeloyl-ACP methyl ester carboxylesterase
MQGITLGKDARCTRLPVLEDPSDPESRLISLNVAVIPAVSRNPAPDPVFFIPGGPGEAATESFIGVSSAFEGIWQKRDIVLVDQRGTGGSNPLECTFADAEESDDPAQVSAEIEQCLQELDADPRFYTTTVAMRDLDRVRQALGYEQINLYGGSYGTRAALEYMRLYPDRVRTAILDGVAPPEWTLGPDAPADAQAALDALFDRCAKQPDCQQAFPNLPEEFAALAEELENGPVTVELNHPVSGQPTTYELNHLSFANTIHQLTYTPETAAMLPLLIHTAYAQDNFSRIAALVLSNNETLMESMSVGMRYSVMCAEDVPFYPEAIPARSYMSGELFDVFRTVCQTWPRGKLETGYKQPVRSDVPTLLISGENDPATPPENAVLAARSLPNSLHVIAPGMGHINIFRGCIPSLAETLIDTGTTNGLDAACVNSILPPPFFINFNGPTP